MCREVSHFNLQNTCFLSTFHSPCIPYLHYLSAMKMSLFIAVCGLFLVSNSLAQKLELIPYWTKGSVHQCELASWEEELRSGQYEVTDTTHEELEWTVTSVHNDHIELLYTIQNPFYTAINSLMDNPYTNDTLKQLKIPCRMSLDSGYINLLNWQELSRIYTRDLLFMKDYLKAHDNEMSNVMSLIIDPYYTLLGTQEGIESVVLKELQFILKAYCKTYTVGDTLEYHTEAPNPLKSGEFMQTDEYLCWSPASNSTTHVIDYHIDFDVSKLKQLMLDMVIKMNEAMGGDPAKNEKKIKEVESYEMYMTNAVRYEIDVQKNELKSCNVVLEFSGHDGRKPRSTRSYRTYSFNSHSPR